MGFSVFLALLIHCILLFGIGITQLEPNTQAAYVTLKLGLSGDSSTQQNTLESEGEDELQGEVVQRRSQEKATAQNPNQSVISEPDPKATRKETVEVRQQKANPRDVVEAFAKFQANFDSQPQTTQGLSRTRELNSFSHFTAPETAYLNTWRRKCERIGRNNYPAGLLEGELTMLVSILRDGSLANVKILRSSGQPKLDAAALATVRQAAPFQPFTVEMRKNYDRLDFTRTWQFSKQGSSLDF